MQQNILVYFRNDLRLHDHEPLYTADLAGAKVIGVYNFNPLHFSSHHLGFRKTGVFRAQFLIECVNDLRNKLQSVGSDLIITHGNPLYTIPDLCKKLRITKVYAHAEHAPEERMEELALEKLLYSEKIDFKLFQGNTLIQVSALPFGIHQTPLLFTDFRKAVEKKAEYRNVFPEVKALRNIEHHFLPETYTLERLGFTAEEIEGKLFLYKGGEKEALKRLHYYIWETELVASYKETRNHLLGMDFSSHFSPWLAAGCLSPSLILSEVRAFELTRIKNDSTYWLIFELLWRDFFRFSMLRYGASYFKTEGIRQQFINWSDNDILFNKWLNGETGYPFIDANMKELKLTGFMSNRGRQNVASFLCKNLGINWLWGAAWFESALVDYDVCSNYGNWAYLAGVGNDARLFRYFNIEKQADTYDKDETFRKHWLEKDGYYDTGIKPVVDFEESIKLAEKKYMESLG
ncbi:MAG: DASH family cryptochrome [Bacteroidota bacterium]|jgi:deoxyribodipyrimidine photo-lyase|nr:DASH family cryptochrome [Sphingobacteriales bacterium]